MKLTTPYADVLLPLSQEEKEALRISIKAEGVLNPILHTEDGRVLDGHHRLKIDKNAPRRAIPDSAEWSDAECKAYVIKCNWQRRNLSPAQKKDLFGKMKKLAIDLRKQDPKKFTQQVLAVMFGVNQTTVARWFSNMRKHNGKVPSGQTKSDNRPDARVSVPKSERKRVAKRAKTEPLAQIASDYGVTESRISQIASAEAKIEAEEAALEALPTDPDWEPPVFPKTMQELLAELAQKPEAERPDAIITDPPYQREFLRLYGELAQLAKDALKPEGILAVMCGQSYLPELLALMTEHLPYRWTLAYLTPGGQAVQLWDRKVNTFWKPVLLFGGVGHWMGDVVRSNVNDNDKRFHHWGQSESGMLDLVLKLTRPAQLVCDPFLGAGTTGVVCVATGREFIGCDTDPAKVERAKQRIRKEYASCQNSSRKGENDTTTA